METGASAGEILLAIVAVGAFGYFIYTRIEASRKRRKEREQNGGGSGGGGGGGRNEPGDIHHR